MLRKTIHLILLVCFVLPMRMAAAQSVADDDIAARFIKVSPQDAENLRAILAEPVETGGLTLTLKSHFDRKLDAANRLGDPAASIALYRQWIAALPQEAMPKNNLANVLESNGMHEEAIQMAQEAMEQQTNEIWKEQYRVNLGWKLFNGGRYEEAQNHLNTAISNLDAAKSRAQMKYDRVRLLRAQSNAFSLQSQLHGSYGRWNESVDAATHAVEINRDALRQALALPEGANKGTWIYNVVADLGNRLARKISALSAAGRFGEAEETLKEYLRLSQERELPPAYLAGIYQIAGSLRLYQREFAVAEDNYRKAQDVRAKLGYDALDQVSFADLIETLEGQHRWNDALAELAHLDALAGHLEWGHDAAPVEERGPMPRPSTVADHVCTGRSACLDVQRAAHHRVAV